MKLFSGSSGTTFKTTKPFEEVIKMLEDSFESIGATDISEKGQILINGRKFDQFTHDATIEGFIRVRDDKYFIELNYEANMTIIAWIILVAGLFCAGVGLLVLLFPFLSKNEMKKKVDKAMDEIRFEFS